MKRLICIALILAICLGLSACGKDPGVTYYYVRDKQEYLYGTADGVMVGESREAAGHVDDLRYLLIIYFHGPVSEHLKSPFPSGTALEALIQEGDHLDVRLSGIVSMMDGTDLTLACACLARTCFGLTDAESVTIHSETFNAVSMTFQRDSLLLADSSARQLTNKSE